MAITYPRDLPSWVSFDASTALSLLRDQSRNQRRGGTVQIVDRSAPRWALDALTAPLDPAQARQFDAWLESLNGGMRDFLWVDLRRRLPQSYPAGISGLTRHGGGAFDGTADVTAISETGLTISTLPSTFALKAGDAIGIEEDGVHALHTITEDATAAAGAVSLLVEPFIKANLFSTSATARVVDPRVQMMLTERDPVDGSYRQSVGFSAIQRIV